MGFLKTILIIGMVYFGLRFLIKLTWPYIVKYLTKKANQKFEQIFQQQSFQRESPKKEGATTIDKNPLNSKKSNTNVGEYVDFEEID